MLGSTGLLGYSLFSNLSDYNHLDVLGVARSISGREDYFKNLESKLIFIDDILCEKQIIDLIEKHKPDYLINCIGVIKQKKDSDYIQKSIEINSIFPHMLAKSCNKNDVKLIHFSTDCVFNGINGNYNESSTDYAKDIYAITKLVGEVKYGKCLTIRTSIIGHELGSSVSLVDWFLSNTSKVKGFSQAIFTGLPTCYIAKIIAEKIILKNITGLYHLSSKPINKYELLKLISIKYERNIIIEEDRTLKIDRSLDSKNLKKDIGLEIPQWPALIDIMYEDYKKRYKEIRCLR